MTPAFLVTHSGGFHADELLSSVILTLLFPQAQIVRSRAPEWITPAPDRIIYDVGGAYDPVAGIFDHHQRGAPLRDDGQPFSSFGLIWRRFGPDYLGALGVPAADRDALQASFDLDFVLPVDLMDNGALDPSAAGPLLADLTLPVLLESLKPVFDDPDPEAETRAFHAGLAVARAFVEAARALGVPRWKIVLRHLVPNMLGTTLVMASYYIAVTVIAEAGLSFIGLGAQPPTPSLGQMVSTGRSFLSRDVWVVILPGGMIALLVLALNTLGDGLRDIFDPRLRRTR